MRAFERLLRYIALDTTSCESVETCPSSPNQLAFAQMLREELQELGLTARVSEQGYVYAELPANVPTERPVLGLIAHMDTAPSAVGSGIKARVVENYDGGEIILNAEKGIKMGPGDYETLAEYVGQSLVVTDGTTLLGGDDKAGVAEIMTLLEELQRTGAPHCHLRIAFTPDEEIGRGADFFDVADFGADFAYTVDGGRAGEIEYENFNAADAAVAVNGLNIHPGDAKGKMKNACLIALEFNALLPAADTPAHTANYEGFWHLCGMGGTEEHAELNYIVRDHDRGKFEAKKELLQHAAGYLNDKHGAGTVELVITDTYYNMKEKLLPHLFLIEDAKQAMLDAGMAPEVVPIRGGTDGARLSYMGLPCPNLSTGGHNFHGRFEYIPIESMDAMVRVLLNLVKA